MDEAARAVNDVVERLRGRQTRKHDIGLRADIGGRTRRYTADFFEFGELSGLPFGIVAELGGEKFDDARCARQRNFGVEEQRAKAAAQTKRAAPASISRP